MRRIQGGIVVDWAALGALGGAVAFACTTWLNPSVRGWEGVAFGLLLVAGYLLAGCAVGIVHALVVHGEEHPPRAVMRCAVLLAFGGIAFAWLLTRGIDNSWLRISARLGIAGVALAVALPGARRGSEEVIRLASRAAPAAVGLLAVALIAPVGACLLPGADEAEPPAELAPSARPLLLIGLDGADWGRLRPLLEQGRLPALAGLLRQGAHGPLRTLEPTWSPRIWNSVVTGRPPEEHGVLDFFEYRLPGQRCGVQQLERRLGEPPLLPGVPGLRPFVWGITRLGLLAEVPVTACQRRVKAVWNVASEAGRRVAVVSWWASWPAEPVNGAMVADMNPYRTSLLAWDTGAQAPPAGVTHPPGLLQALGELEIPQLPRDAKTVSQHPFFRALSEQGRARLVEEDPEALTLFFPGVVRSDAFATATTEALLLRERPDLVAVHLSIIDEASHHWSAQPALIDGAYERADAMVGRILAAALPGTVTVLVSDHGWVYPEDGSGARVGHKDAPDGVFLVSGPGVPVGPLADAPHVLDVAPTLLALIGAPAGVRMPGSAVLAALPKEARGVAQLPRHLYAPHRVSISAEAAAPEQLGEGLAERLRALGYVED